MLFAIIRIYHILTVMYMSSFLDRYVWDLTYRRGVYQPDVALQRTPGALHLQPDTSRRTRGMIRVHGGSVNRLLHTVIIRRCSSHLSFEPSHVFSSTLTPQGRSDGPDARGQ